MDFMKEDKILNNSYNEGEMDYEAFSSPMKIDEGISHLYEDQLSDNLVEFRLLKSLDEDLYEIFFHSKYYNKYKALKKVDKSDVSKMYYYFKDLLIKEKIYSPMQIFIGFAEFFQMNYDVLYQEVGVLDKENILKELKEKGSLKGKMKVKKLF